MNTPLNLEVGSTYRNRAGELVRITNESETDGWPFESETDGWPFEDIAGLTYRPDGRYWDAHTNDMRDLIALVSDAEAAKPAEPPTCDADQADHADHADQADTWITDRLPTAEDADCHGDIELRDYPVFGPWPYHPHKCVVTGEVWRRTKWHPSRSNTTASTPSTPATPVPPTAPLSLEVGATYRTREGSLVRITRKGDHPMWPFEDTKNNSYTPSGYCSLEDMPVSYDIVELVSPANAEEANDADEVAAEADDASDWITDRLPTAEDSDRDGDVELSDLRYVPWFKVTPRTPWRRTEWHLSSTEPAAPTLASPPTPAPLNPFASIQRTVLADGTHILDAIDTAGNAWHRTISTAADWPWQLTTPLPKPHRS